MQDQDGYGGARGVIENPIEFWMLKTSWTNN